MNEAFFEELNEFLENNIQKQRDIIRVNDPAYKLNLVYLNYYKYLTKQIKCIYSMGRPVGDMLPVFEECLQSLTLYKRHPKAKNIFFINEVDEYMNALTLLTWAITLPLSQSRFEELVANIDSEGQHDALLDLLIARRLPNRSLSSALYFPKLYTPLYQAVVIRPTNLDAVALFLSLWYQTCLKKTSTHDIHKLGENSSFAGYWAWEVAGLTYALEIDDTSYQNMPYYPADLVAHARQ